MCQHPRLLLTFCTINLLDIATTAAGLRLGIPEDNPLPAYVLVTSGEHAMYLMKCMVMLTAVFVAWKIYPAMWKGIAWITVILSVVVVNNLVLIFG